MGTHFSHANWGSKKAQYVHVDMSNACYNIYNATSGQYTTLQQQKSFCDGPTENKLKIYTTSAIMLVAIYTLYPRKNVSQNTLPERIYGVEVGKLMNYSFI
jgi:hypothetical protein